MNPSSREIYIIGIFDCGCEYEAGFGSVEIVRCSNTVELNDIKQKMNKHSSEFQCNFRGALCILVFEGKFQYKLRGSVKSYKGFIRTWNIRNKQGRKTERELKQYDRVWDRKWKWIERNRINQDKITAKETANTGCGIS